MNRFLHKKKVRTEVTVEETAKSEAQPLQPVPSSHNWGWGKKKVQVDTKAAPIPTPVLPLSENFRTSLIMPNLSARFSMLREQDDPESSLGKAKDDSVLSPKRRSRLIDFGHVPSNLTEIVEVSATADSMATPPEPQRKTSYTYGEAHDGDDIFSSENGMMNRGRLGESNSLFGGRQKIYRVPSPSGGEAHADIANERQSPRKLRARPLVDIDVGQSAFQKFREEEKQREVEKTSAALSRACSRDGEPAVISEAETVLPFAHDTKRDTTSSSTSGPSVRSFSTAATSYSPQLPAEPLPNLPSSQETVMFKATTVLEGSKSKRLYEQGLAQQMYDQQSAVLTRLNSTRYKDLGLGRLPSVSHSQSVTNLRDRLERSESKAAKKPLPPLELDKLTTFESLRAPKTSTTTTDKALPQRLPLSPFDEESELTNILHEAMHPSDRGKATAMAHFQRPKKFDEQQYLQRQMSLMQQQQRRKRRSVLSPSKKPTFPAKSASPMKPIRPRLLLETRPRAETNDSEKSWSACSDDNESSEFTVRKNTNSLEENIGNANITVTEQARNDPLHGEDGMRNNKGDISPKQDGNLQGSASKSAHLSTTTTPMRRDISPRLGESASPSPRSPEAMKARRNGWSPERLMSGMASASGSPFFKDQQYLDPTPKTQTSFLTADNAQAADLKGLVRTHLRQISNVSTISPSPAFQRPMSVFRNIPSMYGPGQSTDIDYDPRQHRDQPSPTPAARTVNLVLKETVPDVVTSIPVVEAASATQRQHTRGSSTETQHERLAFARELAERQRAIQENLRIKVENEGKSPSPTTTGRNVFEHPFKPFGMLRAMSSRESMSQKLEIPVKAWGWVDMSIEELENGSQAKDGADIRVRSISPSGVGRTLHSRMREAKPLNSSEIRSRKQRQGLSRAGISEKPSPRKQNNRFSRVLAESARNSIILLAASERSSGVQSDPPRTADGGDRQHSSHANGVTETKSFPGQHVRMEVQERHSSSTPKRSTSDDGNPRTNANADHTLEKERESAPIEPNTPASNGLPSHQNHSPNTTTPSTVATSTFSTPNLASSNASISTPKTIDTVSTNSPRPPHEPSVGFYSNPPSLPRPPKTATNRAPLSEIFSQSHNIRSRKPVAMQISSSTIKKSDISEPTLIASTSTVDTIPLPAGASLKNGMSGDNTEIDAVLAAQNSNSNSGVTGSREGLGLGLRADIQHITIRKPWEGKENERRGPGGEKDGGVVKERKGFLARMGRAASSEKKGGVGDWW